MDSVCPRCQIMHGWPFGCSCLVLTLIPLLITPKSLICTGICNSISQDVSSHNDPVHCSCMALLSVPATCCHAALPVAGRSVVCYRFGRMWASLCRFCSRLWRAQISSRVYNYINVWQETLTITDESIDLLSRLKKTCSWCEDTTDKYKTICN